MSFRFETKLAMHNYVDMIIEKSNDVKIVIVFSEGIDWNFAQFQPRKISQILEK